MKRIALFLLTNIAILLVLSLVLRLLGVDRILDESGSGLNYNSLLVFSAVIGFGGAFMSLAMSKWMAKRSTGAKVITQPRNATEQWLLTTVAAQAKATAVGNPVHHGPVEAGKVPGQQAQQRDPGELPQASGRTEVARGGVSGSWGHVL